MNISDMSLADFACGSASVAPIEPVYVGPYVRPEWMTEERTAEIDQLVKAGLPVNLTIPVADLIRSGYTEKPEVRRAATSDWQYRLNRELFEHLHRIHNAKSDYGVTITGLHRNSVPSIRSIRRIELDDYYNDNKVAEEVYYHYGHILAVDETNTSSYFVYDEQNGVWEHHITHDVAIRLVSEVLDRLKAAAQELDTDDPVRKALYKFDNYGQRVSILKAYRTLPNVRRITIADFDRDEDIDLLKVKNGILHLDTFEWEPHNPEYLLMRMAPVEFRPWETAPVFRDMLNEVYRGDQSLIRFVLQSFGLGLTGRVDDKAVFIHNSEHGYSGRSTIKSCIINVLGRSDKNGYVAEVDPSTFETRDGGRGEIRADLMQLIGVRLAFSSEPTRGGRFDVQLLKRISGMDNITTRAPFMKRMVTFMPKFKLIVQSNHIPTIAADDTAMIDRLRIVDYTARFVREPRAEGEYPIDNSVFDKLAAEASGILNVLLDALRDYYAENLIRHPPEAVMAGVTRYLDGLGMLDSFVQDAVEINPKAVTATVDLYEAYKTYLKVEGYRDQYIPLADNFRGMLERYAQRHGYNVQYTKYARRDSSGLHGKRVWMGIRLRGSEPEPSSPLPSGESCGEVLDNQLKTLLMRLASDDNGVPYDEFKQHAADDLGINGETFERLHNRLRNQGKVFEPVAGFWRVP
ncbi:DNA primase family protein [Methanocella sp. MCL-LM]|uniref:DNA primase family protein n=1 Tax=Methanocella sp. MCL-LM TaxID=3412035 RepID=UPI003C7216F3